MTSYPTFDIPKFLDVHLVMILITIVVVIAYAVIFFIYAHNTRTTIFPSGKKVVKRPSDTLPATALTLAVIGLFAAVGVFFAAPTYNDWLMSSKIEKDYNAKVITITKDHSVAVAANGAVYPCKIGSDDQKTYSLMCEIREGRMPLDWVMKNNAK